MEVAMHNLSRQRMNRRQQKSIGALTVGIVIALALAMLSFFLFQNAE
jgi:hypothetical protein